MSLSSYWPYCEILKKMPPRETDSWPRATDRTVTRRTSKVRESNSSPRNVRLRGRGVSRKIESTVSLLPVLVSGARSESWPSSKSH